MLRITIWNEYRHEKQDEKVAAVYPHGIHQALAQGLAGLEGVEVQTRTLEDPDQGLDEKTLAQTDVLFWWGHIAHEEVLDQTIDRVHRRVLEGMGLVALHSAHASKIMQRLLGTQTGNLRWREDDEHCRVWVLSPSHPIAQGLGDYFMIPKDETYGEYFDIPAPDELVFMSWYPGGEVFRSGCCWTRGLGRIFYFQPGHETYPIYYQPEVLQVLRNAAQWAAPVKRELPFSGHCTSLEG